MTTLAEFMIIVGADNRPPMLEKSLYDSWKSRMKLYMENRENGRMILDLVLNGPLVWPAVVQEDGDDLISCLNKAMAFLTAVASLRFPSTNNQLRTSSNIRNQATIQYDKVTVQQGQGRQGKSYAGKGHMARQCNYPKQPKNAAWFKEKEMLAESLESGQILDEEKLAFLADLGILDGQATQITIPNNVVLQTEDLDAYASDCDDFLNAKAVLMANISNYGFDVISEIKLTLYDGSILSSQHAASLVIDDEEILILEEGSRSKMLAKQNDPISKEKKVNTTLINYVELNKLSEDFGKRFVPQQELSTKQAFFLQTFNLNIKPSDISPGRIEAPSELPKITRDVITEGEWTKAIFLKEIIPFLMTLKDIFNVFDKDLLNKDKSYENQHAFEILEYFENNILKAQLQAKDTKICKLKEHIKSMRENKKEEEVKQDVDEIETTNIGLEYSVAKLLSKNKHLHKEIDHLKQIYKYQFDSIKRTRVRTNEHYDSLILQLNSKYVKNTDLKAQIQDKVFVITSLKNDLQKLKGKEIVENATQIPIATTIALGMFKLDLDPLAP
nr:hypothetical protein [Tanacetum cinerariifolium]